MNTLILDQRNNFTNKLLWDRYIYKQVCLRYDEEKCHVIFDISGKSSERRKKLILQKKLNTTTYMACKQTEWRSIAQIHKKKSKEKKFNFKLVKYFENYFIQSMASTQKNVVSLPYKLLYNVNVFPSHPITFANFFFLVQWNMLD